MSRVDSETHGTLLLLRLQLRVENTSNSKPFLPLVHLRFPLWIDSRLARACATTLSLFALLLLTLATTSVTILFLRLHDGFEAFVEVRNARRSVQAESLRPFVSPLILRERNVEALRALLPLLLLRLPCRCSRRRCRGSGGGAAAGAGAAAPAAGAAASVLFSVASASAVAVAAVAPPCSACSSLSTSAALSPVASSPSSASAALRFGTVSFFTSSTVGSAMVLKVVFECITFND